MREAGEKAGMTIEINPKMLRHACGFGLAERGAGTCLIQDFLGHRNARHTKKYTESDDSPFIDLWQDTWGEVTIKQRVVTRVWTGKNRVKKVTVGAKLTPSEITYCTIFLFVLNFNWLD